MISILQREADRITSSQTFIRDRALFSVPIYPGVELPGLTPPASYLTSLGISALPNKVLIVCPGNGGLIAECLSRGTQTVAGLEPRSEFHASLRSVSALMAKGLSAQSKAANHRLFYNWPPADAKQSSADQYDLIIWPIGASTVTQPKAVFQGIANCLAPTGKLIVAINHGSHDLSDNAGDWHPSGDAFLQLAKDVFGGVWTGKQALGATSRIYTLQLVGDKALTKPAAPKEKKKKGLLSVFSRKKKETPKKAPAPKKQPKPSSKPKVKAVAPPPPPPAPPPAPPEDAPTVAKPADKSKTKEEKKEKKKKKGWKRWLK